MPAEYTVFVLHTYIFCFEIILFVLYMFIFYFIQLNIVIVLSARMLTRRKSLWICELMAASSYVPTYISSVNTWASGDSSLVQLVEELYICV